MECVDGSWVCPPPSKWMYECPPGTCFHGPTEACCAPDGTKYYPTCPDYAAPVCPAGTELVLNLGEPCPGAPPPAPGCELTGCESTEVCSFADWSCGSTVGDCRPKPVACDAIYAPVCGCDANVYENECLAHLAGVDLGTDCKAPSGYALCGTSYCLVGTEYCRVTVNGPGAERVWVSECIGLPSGCGTAPSCSCLAGEPCGDQCSEGLGGVPKLSCT